MKTVKETLLLVILSAVAAFLYNGFSTSGIALFGQWDSSRGVVSAKSKNSVVDASREINSLDEMKRIVSEKAIFIADVRPREVYDQGHIPGAVSLPLNRFDDVIEEFIEKVGPDDTVILYCSGRECHESHAFAEKIIEFGYTRARVFSGGYDDWQANGLPVETEVGNAG